jgi:hypothetical protein
MLLWKYDQTCDYRSTIKIMQKYYTVIAIPRENSAHQLKEVIDSGVRFFFPKDTVEKAITFSRLKDTVDNGGAFFWSCYTIVLSEGKRDGTVK